jgi:uncharacterized protein Yka (UPF0111/DUF47 family)
MSEAIMQSLIVGGVAIVSAFIGGILPNRLQRKRDIATQKRQKLEELYTNIERWYITVFNMFCTEFRLVINKNIDWNGYLDRICAMEKEGDHVKSEIILFLYFPELEKEFVTLKNTVQEVNRFIDNDMKELYLSGISLLTKEKEYTKKVLEANKAFSELKSKMNNSAKEIKRK